MVSVRAEYVWVLLLVFLNIKHHNAETVNSTSGNQSAGDGVSAVNSRFFDLGGASGGGSPNFQEPGRYGNPQNNYPGNSFLPYGNQNNNRQPPQDFGWNGRPNQNQNPVYFQGKPYQVPGNYPGNGGGPYQQYPNNYRPGQNNFNGGFNPGYNNMNQNPNYYQRPYPNPNQPGGSLTYPGGYDGPYQNGGMGSNQGGYPNMPRDSMQPVRFPSQNGQYPPQGNFQGNPNPGAGYDSNFRPPYLNDINNIPDTSIQFPGSDVPNQNEPNQYPPQNGNLNIGPNQNKNFPSYSSSNNIQYPMYNPNNNGGSIQFPDQPSNQGQMYNAMPSTNQVVPGSYNGVSPRTQSQLPNNQPIESINGPNANDTAALGNPVFEPSSTTQPDQVMFSGR